ncbi:unnamed protein product [Arctogadus glacialis]
MPVLGGLWAQDLGLRDPGQGVGADVTAGVTPKEEDEGPPSPVWGPLGSSPVTCGALSLALELPALLRQLRAAWRARRGGPRGPEQGQTPGAWRVEVEELEQDAEEKSAQRAADGILARGHAGVLLAERRGSYPLIDLRILNTNVQQGELEAGSRRSVKRQLSFQRYCHASRLLRGQVPRAPGSLHLLDHHYLGQATHMLSKVGTWNFDIFLFERLTNGYSLVTLMCHLLNVYGLIQHFHLDMVKLLRFLGMVQDDYHSHNPYHNALHAADVTQAMYCYLKESKLAELLNPTDVFLGLLAAAAHDVDHPGVNQPFLIKTGHHLASLYQNTSVLESHHWRSTVGMLRESGLLSHLPLSMRQDMEQQLGSLILATDISRQNEFLSTFREHLNHQSLDLHQAPHRHFILQIALKCADVCNPCREWNLSRQWSERVCEEFYRQGDIEKKFALEVSPLCNQQEDSVPSIQIGFISHIVEPLFEEWCRFTEPSPLSHTMMDLLQQNKTCWMGRAHLKEEEEEEEDGGGENRGPVANP